VLPGAAVAVYKKLLDADANRTALIKLITIKMTFFIIFRWLNCSLPAMTAEG